jgi:hypothetical protein
MPRTVTETNSKFTLLAVYSRPFVLTSTETRPEVEAVVLHVSNDSLTYIAELNVTLKRQRSAPSASDADEKPLPSTVIGVPPSGAPCSGHTDDTNAAGRNVNTTLLWANC